MKRYNSIYVMLIILLLVLGIFTLVACGCASADGEQKGNLQYGNLEVGDMLFEDFKVIKVNERTTISLYSYEVVDTNSKVVYLYSYWSNGNATTCTMTPLYNSDGTVRTYGGK